MDSLIKMYEEYKKAAKDRSELDVVEYYSQVLTNLKRKKITEAPKRSEAPKESHWDRLVKLAAGVSGQTIEENAAEAEILLELHRLHRLHHHRLKYTKTDS